MVLKVKPNTEIQKTSCLVALLILFSVWSFLYLEGSFSIILFSLFFLMLGALTISLFSKSSRNEYGHLVIFLSAYALYTLYTVYIDKLFFTNPVNDYYVFRDQLFYYRNAMAFDERGFAYIARDSFNTFEYSSLPLTMFTFQSMFYISSFFDPLNYDPLILKLLNVFLLSLNASILYLLCLKFWNQQVAFLSTLLFALCSHNFFYSAFLLRDQQIATVFTLIAFVGLANYALLKKAILIFCLVLICFYIRKANGAVAGVFGIYFLLSDLYKRMNSKAAKTLFYGSVSLLGLVFLFLFIQVVLPLYQDLYATIESYNSKVEATAGRGGSLGYALRGSLIGHLLLTLFSQIIPFPITRTLEDGLASFPLLIATVFWFIVWSVMVLGLLRVRIRKSIPTEIRNLFLMSLGVIFLTTFASFETRRLLGFYPLIYLVFISVIVQLNKLDRRLFVTRSLGLYAILHVVYFIIK
ncbi:hypothetical protein BFP97_13620 [Roseivirga sp. 4D4]|uniref:hypothetical protein n=1 Tax=Roseivirga sp. 4D4 TaxID=1889784 RepID=UPI000852B21C|nr:hypothetical protein [Roseivirga sp. 4D4]OEK02496.1 hypothetical protein BFP97_13620 [Roseivirga sp. 4D4]